MTSTLSQLTSQYGILKTIASHLFSEDILNLALVSKTQYNEIRQSSGALYHVLLVASRGRWCDGSNGRLRQDDWEREFRNPSPQEYDHRKLYSVKPEVVDKLACRPERDGEYFTKPCKKCNRNVCNVVSPLVHLPNVTLINIRRVAFIPTTTSI